MAAILCEAERTAASEPDLLSDNEARRSLRASPVDGLRQLLAPGENADRPRRRGPSARPPTLRRADEYLCANRARPVHTEEFCAAVGVSASALHEAFHAGFGISPHRYLKLRRLSMARAVLLSRSEP